MKTYTFVSKTENVVKDATLEIVLRLPLEFNKYNIEFSYYCENCFGTGIEDTDHSNEGCSGCNSSGRISKIMLPENLSTILDLETIKQLKNTLIALDSLIS